MKPLQRAAILSNARACFLIDCNSAQLEQLTFNLNNETNLRLFRPITERLLHNEVLVRTQTIRHKVTIVYVNFSSEHVPYRPHLFLSKVGSKFIQFKLVIQFLKNV